MFHSVLHTGLLLFICCHIPLPSATILVTTTDSYSDGSLPSAILAANDGDIIDCSPIAGETIFLSPAMPAIGHNFTSSSSSITIQGAGVILDGGGNRSAFSLAYGRASINGFTIQNGLSAGGEGGFGFTGGGGGTGGGGALYVHAGTIMTISTMALIDNQAVGGAGGAGNSTGGSGGGGGGFGGGHGGFAIATGSGAGSGGGGGGNNGGASGGRDGGIGIPNSFSNFAGAGGGGEVPGTTGAKYGGNNASIPAKTGGRGGIGTVSNGAGAGGGGGGATVYPPTPPGGGAGFSGFDAINASPPGSGVGGAGGFGFGVNYTYGAGGGGGGGNGGGAGYGTSGGGGGLNGPGGAGGDFGGGGGASSSSPYIAHIGGNGGFGAGGGGGYVGGTDAYGVGGSGGSATDEPAAGGGGSGLGGAIYIQQGGLLVLKDPMSFSGNSTTAGAGGTAAGGGSSGENGSSLGQDIFIQSGGAVTFQIANTLTLSNPIEGAGLLSEATEPGVVMSGLGTLTLTGTNSYLGGTLIESGKLILNGSISGDLSIESAGILSGSASVNGNINSSGTIEPAFPISTIAATDVYFSPTASYSVEIDPANASLLLASGSCTLGGTLQVVQNPGSYPETGRYLIIQAADGIVDAFSGIYIQPLPNFLFTVENDGNNFYLTYTLLPSAPIDVKCSRCKHKIVLEWSAPTQGSNPISYQIYRNSLNNLIGVVSASDELKFEDSICSNSKGSITYYIVSVDQQNLTSPPASTTLHRRAG